MFGVVLTLVAVAMAAAVGWNPVFRLVDWWVENRPVRSYHLLFVVAVVCAVAQMRCSVPVERLACVFFAVAFAVLGGVSRAMDREWDERREQDERLGYGFYGDCA